MMNTTLNQTTQTKENTNYTYNQISIIELKKEISIVEELISIKVSKLSTWFEKSTGIAL